MYRVHQRGLGFRFTCGRRFLILASAGIVSESRVSILAPAPMEGEKLLALRATIVSSLLLFEAPLADACEPVPERGRPPGLTLTVAGNGTEVRMAWEWQEGCDSYSVAAYPSETRENAKWNRDTNEESLIMPLFDQPVWLLSTRWWFIIKCTDKSQCPSYEFEGWNVPSSCKEDEFLHRRNLSNPTSWICEDCPLHGRCSPGKLFEDIQTCEGFGRLVG